MRNIWRAAAPLILIAVLAGCGGGDAGMARIHPPMSAGNAKKGNYQEVAARFHEAGFINVRTEAIEDLLFGWLTKDGEVEEVTIDGRRSFSAGSWFAPDAEVAISYHTFPARNPPEPEADPEPEDVPDPEPVILTAEDSAEFRAVLNVRNSGDPLIAAFAEEHAGELVSFDGYVAYMNYHGSYDTRFDFLIFAGDSAQASGLGPNFQFEDCGYADLGLTGETIPETIRPGDNFHFTAEIVDYNADSQLFHLKPVETTVR